MKKNNLKYTIIFDHPEYVIANKPAGLLSVPERFTDAISLKRLLRDKYGEIYAVHRLDKNTSGLILFAKNKNSHKIWNDWFEQRKVLKKYQAIVTGQFRDKEGKIDLPIFQIPGKNEVIIHKKGKTSLTEYQVLEQFRRHAWLDLNLQTGRTHQIRVHLTAIGHPLLVDSSYGGRDEFFVSQVKGKGKFHLEKGTEERPLLTRTPLHAYHLGFKDPFEENIDRTFTVELPKDMRATLNQLQKWDK